MAKRNTSKPYINGQQVRSTHSATIGSVLADHSDVPPVSSKGSSFYNADSWTLRVLCQQMCQWASQNKGCIPTEEIIRGWVTFANRKIGSVNREIVIAATGDQLDRSMMLALVGGGYHEAWHSRYSKRDRLDPNIVVPNILKRWALVKDWSPFHNELQKWNNVVEDIRIERVGIKEFPPTRHSMVELQDFVLNLEKQGLDNARAHGHTGERNALSVITGAFRDLGLGYTESALQNEIILSYQKDNKDGFDLVDSGALRDLLDKSINLTTSKEDQYECLWIAMDIIVILVQAGDDGDQGDGEGEPQETKCPKCGASKDKLKIRKGNNGQYLLVCTDCGHQQEVEISEGGQGGDGQGESFEMEDQDGDDQDGENSEKGDDQDGDQKGDQGSDGDDQGDGDDQDGDTDGGGSKGEDKPTIYKVGDRAMLNGREVVVTTASKPDSNGLQDLQVEPV